MSHLTLKLGDVNPMSYSQSEEQINLYTETIQYCDQPESRTEDALDNIAVCDQNTFRLDSSFLSNSSSVAHGRLAEGLALAQAILDSNLTVTMAEHQVNSFF